MAAGGERDTEWEAVRVGVESALQREVRRLLLVSAGRAEEAEEHEGKAEEVEGGEWVERVGVWNEGEGEWRATVRLEWSDGEIAAERATERDRLYAVVCSVLRESGWGRVERADGLECRGKREEVADKWRGVRERQNRAQSIEDFGVVSDVTRAVRKVIVAVAKEEYEASVREVVSGDWTAVANAFKRRVSAGKGKEPKEPLFGKEWQREVGKLERAALGELLHVGSDDALAAVTDAKLVARWRERTVLLWMWAEIPQVYTIRGLEATAEDERMGDWLGVDFVMLMKSLPVLGSEDADEGAQGEGGVDLTWVRERYRWVVFLRLSALGQLELGPDMPAR
jgi:hypothetical protein